MFSGNRDNPEIELPSHGEEIETVPVSKKCEVSSALSSVKETEPERKQSDKNAESNPAGGKEKSSASVPVSDVNVSVNSGKTAGKNADSDDKRFEEMWNFAADFAENNPDKFDLVVKNFTELSRAAAGTKYKMMADVEIEKLKKARGDAIDSVMKTLDDEAAVLINKQDFRQAAGIYQKYTGRLAVETETDRKKTAADLIARAEKIERKQQMEQKKFYRRFAASMLKGDWNSAKQELLSPPGGVEVPSDAVKTVDELLAVNKKIFGYMKKNLGRTVYVNTVSGRMPLKIKRIKNNTVYIEEKKGKVTLQKKFSITNLSPEEKVRLSGISETAGAFFLAADAFRRKDMEAGVSQLQLIKGFFRDVMGDSLQEFLAELGLRAILNRIDLKRDINDVSGIAEELTSRGLSPLHARRLAAAVGLYRKRFGTTTFAGRHENLLKVLESGGATVNEGDDERRGEPESLSRNKLLKELEKVGEIRNITRLKKALGLINPEYTGGGHFVTSRGNHIVFADLSDVRGIDNISLMVLKHLFLNGLDISKTDVTDISPLSGMELKMLNLNECRVDDLSPLKNMKSLKKLLLFHTKVRDLTPLQELSIEILDIAENEIDDIEPLKGMPLSALRIFNCPVRDFSPLSRCKSLQFIDPWELWREVPGKEYKADKQHRFPPGLFAPKSKPRQTDDRYSGSERKEPGTYRPPRKQW